DGFGLSGPWPWAAWLFVCSGAYWFTEIRVGGRFFGVTGAAAQIAWWWLLGQGLGWTTAPRFAGIALIGLVWAYVGSLARDEGPFAPLASLLRVASPVVIGGAALAVMVDLGIGPATWTEVISAAVVGGAATAAVGRWNLPFGAAALAQVPLFAALFNNIYSFGAGWEHVVLFVVLAFAYAAAELWRGGWTHGVLALVAELAGWLSLVWVLDAATDVTVAILLGVGASWLLSAHLLMRSPSARDVSVADRVYSLATAARIGGWLLLAAATVLVPGAREVVPLAGMALEPRDVALTLWLFAVWAGLMWVVRSPAALLASLPASVYAVAALLAYFAPSWHSGLYAAVLLVAVAAWLPVRGALARRADLDPEALGWVVRVAFGLVVFIGLLSAEVFFGSLVSFETAFMFAVAGTLWGADALAPRGQRLGLVFAAPHLVAAVIIASWHVWSPELAGVLGAAAGALGCAAGLLGRHKVRELGTIWTPAAA
ncbi:MAG: hypothetical protein Q8M66_05395, partial [Actinomycetota bacterium]|nr:hypothetical protein [Actinomycetota bacterium]